MSPHRNRVAPRARRARTASCPKLIEKLTAKYGPKTRSGLDQTWKVGGIELYVQQGSGTCNLGERIPK